MGRIKIRNIQQQFRIGCGYDERIKPQILSFDIELEFPMEAAIGSDSLNDTVNYMQVIEAVRSLAERGEWKLVERLCSDLASEILGNFPLLEAVTVHLTKRNISDVCDGIVCSYRSGKI